jgi:hypothetical protein
MQLVQTSAGLQKFSLKIRVGTGVIFLLPGTLCCVAEKHGKYLIFLLRHCTKSKGLSCGFKRREVRGLWPCKCVEGGP